MCGIAGELSFSHQLYPSEIYHKIKEVLKHRGPDQNGMYQDQSVALIHTRLAIVDKETGVQPMVEMIGDNHVVLVYNGELYNTEEIREELIARGVQFSGHGDTEVILKSYLEFKEKCVEKMNGIFAFAIWDERSNALFVARDRMGVKPFFYTLQENRFLFASEIKGILAHPDVEAIINTESLYELIAIGPGRTMGQAIFKGIKELLPGECGYIKDGKLNLWKYWELKDRPWPYDFETTAKKVRELLLDSIERQLISDVPICTFLSGGLDSSIISAVASQKLKEKGEKLNTISVEYQDNEQFFRPSFFQPNRDEYYVNLMSENIESRHHNIILDSLDVAAALDEAMIARDLPGMVDVDSSLLLFSKEIKKVASVALSGECADEIFGGYPWFRDERVINQPGFPWAKEIDSRMSFLKEKYRKWSGEEYMLTRAENTKRQADIGEFNTDEQAKMKRMMKLNLDWFMQTLLDRKDRMSMACGLEVRVPFCDYRLVEMLYAIPWEHKNWRGREKGLLRYAVQDLLPEEVVWRKKSPYPKTHHPVYLKTVKSMLKQILENQDEPIHQYFDEERLWKLIEEDSVIPWYGQLMTTPQTIAYFIQINSWLKTYHVRFEED